MTPTRRLLITTSDVVPAAIAKCVYTQDPSVTPPYDMRKHLLHMLARSMRCRYTQRPYAFDCFRHTLESLNLAKSTRHDDNSNFESVLDTLPMTFGRCSAGLETGLESRFFALGHCFRGAREEKGTAYPRDIYVHTCMDIYIYIYVHICIYFNVYEVVYAVSQFVFCFVM